MPAKTVPVNITTDGFEDDVTHALLREFEYVSNQATETEEQITVDSHSVFLFTKPTEDTLTQAIRGGFSGCLELTEHAGLDDSTRRLICQANNDIWFASFFSKSIYKSPFVAKLVEHLTSDSDASSHLDPAMMRTAIDEAVLNSIVHGNLGLPSPPIDSIDDLSAFYEEVGNRITEPQFSHKRIAIQTWREGESIWVSVGDEGSWHRDFKERRDTHSDTLHGGTTERRKTGRGLDIIYSTAKDVYIDSHNRCLAMRF